MPILPPLRFTGAAVLRDGEIQNRSVAIEDGRITKGPLAEVDMSGYYILTGIIDMHGDAFERHIAPRPSAPFPIHLGLHATEKDAASSGVTTAWLAQCWSWEGGKRGPEFAEKVVGAITDYNTSSVLDLRIQIRCETHMSGTEDQLLSLVRRAGIDYVVFNNHLPEALQMIQKDPHQFAAWAAREKRSAQEFEDVINDANSKDQSVPRFICKLADSFDSLGVTYGSHDDPDGESREIYRMFGAEVCEFPISFSAASAAKAMNSPVIMDAPNVVRGGSQAGNISAQALIERDACDALVSDYHYQSLKESAFALADRGVCDLPKAWNMISKTPADIMGLGDRGEITMNKRADLVFINAETRQIEATICGGSMAYMSGQAGVRLCNAIKSPSALAAE